MTKSNRLPDPGKGRFWYGVHQPNSTTKPLVLELREKLSKDGPTAVSLSKLIAKEGTIADPDALHETAERILARASRVEEFTGILP